ncbi:nucleotidyl transferase AbiEii/AbiGii toxin family protein [Neomegalonema sp.]|uniref:nucleotidyl transferase AbiEii/AbiGii toxin family protein n=1 Tax=Neomegalonema sp. TaxID=2039713 RepID=UPI002614A868|nr:nucleotidyl transferase AbiEii/AbiGii toxin family protein [Neomegalonema sp.]MDD2870146.1 nucleotidyl transferase AbiEii/AbiGii toxin family protein [Neomegalonema sp.]
MDKVALLPAEERAALFGETAAARGVADAIVEKDFWVCWTLKRLFHLPRTDAPALVFKGGTSLSKAFNVIRRFSEDIDISLDRAELGYRGERDPDQEGISRKRSAQLIGDLMGDVERHIAEKLLPALHAAITEQLGSPTDSAWSLEIDPDDAQTVNFFYPPTLDPPASANMSYITPRVKLELGARGDPWPTEERVIRPYAAEEYPDFFEDPDCVVTVLSARRTFWEKATALHAEAHRPAESPTPQYFSRHYYDLAMLFASEEGKAAAADLELLAQVAKHKGVFFRSGWASYETARPGSLRLTPSEARIRDLRADYKAMAAMIFDAKPPSFDRILADLSALQDLINASGENS